LVQELERKIQTKLQETTSEDLEKRLALLYQGESEKLLSSVKEYCKQGSSAGITQTIGRRFGYFWEEMVKDIFEFRFKKSNKEGLQIDISSLVLETVGSTIAKNSALAKRDIQQIMDKMEENLKDILETGVLGVADFIYETEDNKKRALEIKWRVRWNDSKTVKSHCFAFHRLKDRGFEPIMLIRRPKKESFIETVERFEREGWLVLTGKEAMDFIFKETEIDLEKWIRANVDFWKVVLPFEKCLKGFTLTPSDFQF